jgi:hypothetical protein
VIGNSPEEIEIAAHQYSGQAKRDRGIPKWQMRPTTAILP